MKLQKAIKAAVISHQVLLAMVFIQSGYAGVALKSKALNDGINPLVFNVYGQAIATIILALLVLFFQRLVLFFHFAFEHLMLFCLNLVACFCLATWTAGFIH